MSGKHQSKCFHLRWCWDVKCFYMMTFEWVTQVMHIWGIWLLCLMKGSEKVCQLLSQQTSQKMRWSKNSMRELWAGFYIIQMLLFLNEMTGDWQQQNILRHNGGKLDTRGSCIYKWAFYKKRSWIYQDLATISSQQILDPGKANKIKKRMAKNQTSFFYCKWFLKKFTIPCRDILHKNQNKSSLFLIKNSIKQAIQIDFV